MKIAAISVHQFSVVIVLVAVGIMWAGCADTQSTQGDAKIAQAWKLEPAGGTWKIDGKLLAPANISAIASHDGESFLIGSDDLTVAQHGFIDREARRLSIRGAVNLYRAKGADEVDIEGIAAAPSENCYYVTGSHSLTKKGNMNKERRSFFHVGAGGAWNQIARKSLEKTIKADAVLKDYWEQATQQGGINIEGLAWKEGALFFGFRSPNIDDNALVLEVNAQGAFRKGKDSHTLHHVPLGDGLGIREIVSIREGFLIVAGNAGDAPTAKTPSSRDYLKGRPYTIFFWDAKRNAVKRLATITRPGRPEAMLVLEDSERSTDLLILFDGVIGGSPIAYTLTKG